jgi:hypothetical protein
MRACYSWTEYTHDKYADEKFLQLWVKITRQSKSIRAKDITSAEKHRMVASDASIKAWTFQVQKITDKIEQEQQDQINYNRRSTAKSP